MLIRILFNVTNTLGDADYAFFGDFNASSDYIISSKVSFFSKVSNHSSHCWVLKKSDFPYLKMDPI